MLFFCIKNIGKNDTVFGEYKKAKNNSKIFQPFFGMHHFIIKKHKNFTIMSIWNIIELYGFGGYYGQDIS